MASEHRRRDPASVVRWKAQTLLSLLLPAAFQFVSAEASDTIPSNVTLMALVDRKVVPTNETVLLNVLVEWQGPADRYRFGWPETPEAHRLAVVGSRRGSKSWVDEAGEHSRQEFTYVLQPQEVGQGTVGAVRLTYWDVAGTARHSTTLMTLPISLDIVPSARSDRSGPWGDAAISLAVLAAAGLSIWWLRVRGRTGRRAARSAAPPVPDELDGRMRMLARARADLDATQFYDEAVAVVRIVLARTLGEPVTGKGTDDLVGLLEKTGWPEDATASLRLLLEKADRRRFAPSRPEAWELAQDEATVRGVLDLAARPADAPAAAAEEGNVQ